MLNCNFTFHYQFYKVLIVNKEFIFHEAEKILQTEPDTQSGNDVPSKANLFVNGRIRVSILNTISISEDFNRPLLNDRRVCKLTQNEKKYNTKCANSEDPDQNAPWH